MPHEMSTEERRQFLLAPGRTGHLATVRPDGRPHVAPVWFTLDGDDCCSTPAPTPSRDATCSTRPAPASPSTCRCCPTPSSTSRGRSPRDDPERYRPWARRISAKYVPVDEVEAYTDRNAVPGELLVRLTPETIVAVADLAGWD